MHIHIQMQISWSTPDPAIMKPKQSMPKFCPIPKARHKTYLAENLLPTIIVRAQSFCRVFSGWDRATSKQLPGTLGYAKNHVGEAGRGVFITCAHQVVHIKQDSTRQIWHKASHCAQEVMAQQLERPGPQHHSEVRDYVKLLECNPQTNNQGPLFFIAVKICQDLPLKHTILLSKRTIRPKRRSC